MLKQTIVLEVTRTIGIFKCLEASLGRMCKIVFQIRKATEKSQFIHFQRRSKKKASGGLITAQDIT